MSISKHKISPYPMDSKKDIVGNIPTKLIQSKKIETQEKIVKVIESLKNMLISKNKKYGDSALHGADIFSKFINTNGSKVKSILIRLDDKIKRIENSTEIHKNDVADIIGYLILLSIGMGWEDFKDLID